jgi:cobalamin biosynthesis protein CobT
MGGRMDTAKKATIAMAEALKALDIPFEVTGFYSEPDSNVAKVYAALPEESKKRFNRKSERLELHIFKSFDAPTLSGIEKLHPGSQNPDGECVQWAAKRLSERKEKRKILMVLSDGEPATGDSRRDVLCSDLRRRIMQIEKSGIECVGVGIQTPAVKEFYPDFIVLNDLKDLPKAAMTKLSKLLVR